MGLTKSDLFTKEQNEVAQLAKVFAHPARIAILQHLIQANECINSDLVQELGLAQATISQHLKELKSMDIIQGSVEGKKLNYCINPNKWKQVAGVFASFFADFPYKTDCCS